MKIIFAAGAALALGVYAVTFALHLLNRPSDLAVAGGYVILLFIFAVAAEAVGRYRKGHL